MLTACSEHERIRREAVVTYASVRMHWLTVTAETCESSDLWPGVHSNTGKPVIVSQFTRRTELNLTIFAKKKKKSPKVTSCCGLCQKAGICV